MRVRFFLRKSRLNSLGTCPLDCRVTVNGVHATPFSTHIMVAPEKWESKSQRIKGSSAKINTENRKLETIKYELEQIYNINRAKLVFLSARELVDLYSGKREFGCSFTQLCKKKIDSLKSLNRAPGTINIHKRCHRLLHQFLKEDLQANEIQKRHIVSFWSHLKNKGYDHDYVNKTVANCKSLFIFGEKEGYVDVNPFKSITFTWENKFDLTRLEEWEMDALKNGKWSPVLQKVVDSFLFMCYQGLHISDYRKLAMSSIITEDNVKWVSIERTKTKVEATIPLHSYAEGIIKKYGDIKNLPKIAGQTSNDHLKIIAERIGTTKHLTNKVARKTFTDMCINEYRMSDESVAAMLGHKSTKYVKKYGAVRKNRILAEWKDRLDVSI
jgi:site-specific recombinase XerD